MRILILGVTGMLGSTLFRYFSRDPNLEIYGSMRRATLPEGFDTLETNQHVICNVAAETDQGLATAFSQAKPDVVINCVGVVKQLAEADDPLISIPINSLLPHRLASLAQRTSARTIHVSTDCVFSGKRGHYLESDTPDASDLYARSKLLGELYAHNTLTLRTSIIGHELATKHGLLEWFLAESGQIDGFSRAIFSGLPTVELAQVIHEFVLPNSALSGLYHVSVAPISKLELLQLIAKTYRKSIAILPSDRLVIDRSLDSTRFRAATGYTPPEWKVLIEKMHRFH